jgi:sodium transport system permease protein
LSLAIAAFARSSKEGQYYLMPLLIITLPLMMLSVVPAAELNLGTSLIPVTGMLLLLQRLVEARYAEALPFVLPVVGMTAVCCGLAIRWAISQFNNESVLFRENERWGLRLWLRHLIRDRGDTPSFSEAMLCGVILLVIGFFAGLMVPQATEWPQIALSMSILQIAMIATPVLIMALMLTRSPRRTLLLHAPRPMALPAALLLGVALHPLVGLLGWFVQWLYPLNPDVVTALKPIEAALAEAPLWQVLLVIALLPAVCEELAYRGFILSGLRRAGHKWTAIALASLFFGLAHGIFQQKLTSCAIGLVLGYLAVQTRSLLPCMAFHFTNNALVVLMSRVGPEVLEAYPWLGRLLRQSAEGQLTYRLPVYIMAASVSVGLLWWFRRLAVPPEDPAEDPAEETAASHGDESPLPAGESPDSQRSPSSPQSLELP